jgi:hypothetical protein
LEADGVVSARGSGVEETKPSKVSEAEPGGGGDRRRRGRRSGGLSERQPEEAPWRMEEWRPSTDDSRRRRLSGWHRASTDGAQPEEEVVERAGQRRCASKEAATREMSGVAANLTGGGEQPTRGIGQRWHGGPTWPMCESGRRLHDNPT